MRGREAVATSGPASSCQPSHLRSAEDLRAAGGSSRQPGAAAAGSHPDQQEEEGWCTVRRARSRYDPDNGNVGYKVRSLLSSLKCDIFSNNFALGEKVFDIL